ncbi:MAG: hypothetical protein ABR866_17275 [Candidatus Korobacteraceae bacterium]
MVQEAQFVTEAGDWTGSAFRLSRKLVPSYGSPTPGTVAAAPAKTGNVPHVQCDD